MTTALLFIGGFFTGMIFTLAMGWYLSDYVEKKEGRKL